MEAGNHSTHQHPLWLKVLVGVLAVVALLILLVAFFPWDTLRGPLNRYVSDKTGRHFEITRHLDVKVGRTTRIFADGIEFANPDWAKDPYLVKAEAAQIDIELFPLLRRRIVMPRIEFKQPQLGLQVEPDGRRTWALGRDTKDSTNVPDIGALVVDKGAVHYIDSAHGADIQADFVVDGALTLPPVSGSAMPADAKTGAAAMPLSYSAKGTWEKEPFTAKGRTGNVLYLSAPLQNPFPMEVDAVAGATSLRASGQIASLSTLDGADAVFDLKGKNLADLYKLVGVVLPSTPRYAVRGHLSKQGEVWHMRDLNGKLGNSDLAGELSFDRAQKVKHLAGNLKSNLLDFDDLAPIVGLPEQLRKAPAQKVAQADQPKTGLLGRTKKSTSDKAPKDPNRKVLPTAQLDLSRLKTMNSEVTYSAAKVTNAGAMPLDRMSMSVRLKDGVLNLDPLDLGIAGGKVTGRMRIDSHNNPAVAEVHLKARSLELSKLFTDVNLTKTSFGKIHGDIDLTGRGNSVAQMLAGSSGNFALLMGKGQISNLLLEVAGLDGGEIIKFLLRGDANVGVRCAATAFDVKNGLMTSRALMLDTVDTIVYGEGSINFANERLDLYFHPYPKDTSILSLRSPLKVTGTLGAPDAGPDKGALAGRAGLALALGAINPLLALAATVETGPGENADCGAVLKDAASPGAAARVEALSRTQQKAAAELGAAPRKPQAGQTQGASQGKVPAAPSAPARDAGPHAPGAPGKLYGS